LPGTAARLGLNVILPLAQSKTRQIPYWVPDGTRGWFEKLRDLKSRQDLLGESGSSIVKHSSGFAYHDYQAKTVEGAQIFPDVGDSKAWETHGYEFG